jgi:outer membrane receptor protein involved in Fe transport
MTDHFQLFMQINNILDKHYSTAAQLSTTPFDNNDHFVAQPFGTPYGDDNVPIRSSSFQAPGAPFNIYGGLKFTFWKKQ